MTTANAEIADELGIPQALAQRRALTPGTEPPSTSCKVGSAKPLTSCSCRASRRQKAPWWRSGPSKSERPHWCMMDTPTATRRKQWRTAAKRFGWRWSGWSARPPDVSMTSSFQIFLEAAAARAALSTAGSVSYQLEPREHVHQKPIISCGGVALADIGRMLSARFQVPAASGAVLPYALPSRRLIAVVGLQLGAVDHPTAATRLRCEAVRDQVARPRVACCDRSGRPPHRGNEWPGPGLRRVSGRWSARTRICQICRPERPRY